MIKVPQELIDEAAKRGIVPGARIMCAGDCSIGTVGDVCKWHMTGSTEEHLCVGTCDNSTRLFAKHSNRSWATVITPAPAKEEEGLKEGDACECGPAMRAAIVELAKELDLCDGEDGGLARNPDTRGVYCLPDRHLIHVFADNGDALNLHTPEAFIAKMRVTAKRPKPIKIGGHTVVFNSGSIKVGCTTVDSATVRAIAEKLIDR